MTLRRAAAAARALLNRTDARAIRTARAAMSGLLCLGYGAVVAVAFVNAVEDSPLVPSFRSRANITTMLPEGWAFFTRNPREAQWTIFAPGAGGWRRLEQRHATRFNHFGFGRDAPLRMMELSAVVGQAPDSAWASFAADTDPLVVAAAAEAVPVRNPALRPFLCNDILVVEREPVPWAWSTMARSVRMAGRVLRLSIACDSPSPDRANGR